MSQMTQVEGRKPKQLINIDGIDYRLRRDAADPTSAFDHNRVFWINAGCTPVAANVNFCWILGIVTPTPNSLETPVSVVYAGFHPNKITMNPQSLTQQDLDRMHVYVGDARDFANKFARNFLSMGEPAMDTREPISPYPSVNELVVKSDKTP